MQAYERSKRNERKAAEREAKEAEKAARAENKRLAELKEYKTLMKVGGVDQRLRSGVKGAVVVTSRGFGHEGSARTMR
jgi:hypothetical protein